MTDVAVLEMGLLRMHCPGCGEDHQVPVDTTSGPNDWTWNGSLTAPTLTPSILVHSHWTLDDAERRIETPRCHSYVRDGKWEYLGDCTHEFAGETLALPPIHPEPTDDKDTSND